MLEQIRTKFRAGENLSASDGAYLKRLILESPDAGIRSEAIYFYGYSFKYDNELADEFRRIIVNERVPELTAKAIDALCYYWSVLDDELVAAFLYYLESDRFEIFFDECQVITRIYRENRDSVLMVRLCVPVEVFLEWAKQEGYDFD